MAVPKAELREGLLYSAFGATLRVERCFGEGGSCETAMITSTCSSPATCSCRRTDAGKTRIVFYYARDLGVTAFYSAMADTDETLEGIAERDNLLEDSIPLRTFVLVADKGFLSAPLNLKNRVLRENCVEQ